MKRTTEIIVSDDVRTSLEASLEAMSADGVFLLADEHTMPIANALFDISVFSAVHTVPAGEACKSWDVLHGVLAAMENAHLSRSSVIVNFGGGAVSDLGGLAAALMKRGIKVINVATTLLAAVDAAVGGKTGINFMGMKNEIGVVRMPDYVIISLEALRTLPKQEWLNGYGEVFKYALLVRGGELVDAVEQLASNGANLNWQRIIELCVDYKSRVVRQDPDDLGCRHVLNLGHTVAHALEELAAEQGKTLPHGIAVGRSLPVVAYISYVKCGLGRKTVAWLRKVCCDTFGLMDYDCKEVDRIVELMKADKKNSAGHVNMVLLSAMCSPECDIQVGDDLIREAINFYM